jgi:hypothetical protein
VKIALILLAVVGAVLYIGGSFLKAPRLALGGIIFLDAEFAIVAGLLLYARSYVLGGAFGLGAVWVFSGLLKSSSKDKS